MLTLDEALKREDLSKAEVDAIGKSVLAEHKAQQIHDGVYKNHVYLGKEVRNDVGPVGEGILEEMYENFLACVQQGLNPEWNVNSTFEQWLAASLERLKERRSELSQELLRSDIDQRTYNSGKAVIEMATEVIRIYLEKNPTAKAIGL